MSHDGQFAPGAELTNSALEPLESSPLGLETDRSPDGRLAVLGGGLIASVLQDASFSGSAEVREIAQNATPVALWPQSAGARTQRVPL